MWEPSGDHAGSMSLLAPLYKPKLAAAVGLHHEQVVRSRHPLAQTS